MNFNRIAGFAAVFSLAFFLAGQAAASELGEQLLSQDDDVRLAAADKVDGLEGSARSKLVKELTKALRSKDAEVRYHAVYALMNFGPEARKAIPNLVKMLDDQGLKGSITFPVMALLKSMGKDAVPKLKKALKPGKGSKVRENAASVLGEIGSDAKDAVPLLIKAAGDKELALRRAAVQALGRIGPVAGAAVPELSVSLKDEDNLLRAQAAKALKLIGTPEALKALSGQEKPAAN